MDYTTKNLLQELHKAPVFNLLTSTEMNEIGEICSYKKLEKGKLLFNQEESPRYLFYILSGELELTLVDDSIISLQKGELLGGIGLLHGEFRTGIVRVKEDVEMIQICGKRLFNKDYIPAETSLKLVREIARRSIGHLQNREQSSAVSLIQNGENDSVEFKSTMRLNLHSNDFDKRIELACLKTIAAFLNTDGGTLLIGVEDSGACIGLDHDRFKSNDSRLLHLNSLVKTSMGELSARFINAHHVQVKDSIVLRVDCRAANSAIYLKWQQDEHFYIRTGPSTTSLKISSIHSYIQSRFHSEITTTNTN